jgi:hypothetical protein
MSLRSCGLQNCIRVASMQLAVFTAATASPVIRPRRRHVVARHSVRSQCLARRPAVSAAAVRTTPRCSALDLVHPASPSGLPIPRRRSCRSRTVTNRRRSTRRRTSNMGGPARRPNPPERIPAQPWTDTPRQERLRREALSAKAVSSAPPGLATSVARMSSNEIRDRTGHPACRGVYLRAGRRPDPMAHGRYGLCIARRRKRSTQARA